MARQTGVRSTLAVAALHQPEKSCNYFARTDRLQPNGARAIVRADSAGPPWLR